ncbi:MAG: rhomboid family intramembrane serine protease [Planctomycetes bacterium]|nr:rhomboid family intramembrane serine protease [Planctomycetota bacterium]
MPIRCVGRQYGMGLQDRDFMREPPPGAGAWLKQSPAYVHLIAINVAVWVLMLFLGGESSFARANFFVSPSGVFEDFRVWTLVTSAFTHLDLMHIALNMLLLYYMGQILHARGWSNGDLWTLYLAAGVGGSLAFCGLGAARGTWFTPAIGASGAVYGFLISGALIAPNLRLYLWGLLPLPLWGLAIGYTALDLMGATGQFGSDQIAHAAHLGGAAVGLVVTRFDLRPSRRRRRPKLVVLDGGRAAPPATPPASRPAAPAPSSSPAIDNATASRVDELLRKIKREGLHALSDEERQFLEQASRRYPR